jgi:rubrerythrin
MDPIRSTAELYAQALAMEEAAARRYVDLALRMHAQGDEALAELFWRLGRQEGEHYASLLRRIDEEHVVLPAVAPEAARRAWEAPSELALRLTTRSQALALALDAERRSRDFFAFAAQTAADLSARTLARELVEEEGEHICLLLEEMQRPQPVPGRASDWDRLFVESASG